MQTMCLRILIQHHIICSLSASTRIRAKPRCSGDACKRADAVLQDVKIYSVECAGEVNRHNVDKLVCTF